MRKPFLLIAPNGARRGTADHPALPVSLSQIVDTAVACAQAGADGLHLHVRDDDGAHSLDAGRYLETITELARVAPDLRVQITTEAAGVYDVPAQLDCLQRVRPEWASISVREIARAPKLADAVYGTCADNGTEVQHILYDADDIALLRDWQGRGLIRPGQDSVLLVLGRYTSGQTSDPADIAPLVDKLPNGAPWMLCAFGPQEHACLLAAMAQGGDARVGFENSLNAADGTPHADNAASLRALITEMNRRPQ